MNKIFLIIIVVMVFLSANTLTAYSQEAESFSINTSKSLYFEGDTIVIFGSVTHVIENEIVTIQIFHEGNVVDIKQIPVAQDGSFTHSLIAEGPLWENDGEYVIRGYYGGGVAETTFDFSTKKDIPATNYIFEVNAGNSGAFDVEYTIKGGTVKDMVVDPDILGLVVIIQSTDDGTISLNLPRDSIDAKTQDGEDDTYIVLIDGIQVVPQETKEIDSRILTIPFEEGDSDIDIIGTFTVLNKKPGIYSDSGSAEGIRSSSAFRIIPEKPNVGSIIRVVGSDFAPSSSFEFYLGSEKLGEFLTDNDGYFVTTMEIPDDQTSERVEFIVKDSANNEKLLSIRLGGAEDRVPQTDDAPFTADISSRPEPVLSVSIDSSSYVSGDVISISGTIENFQNNFVTLKVIDPEGIKIWEEDVLIKDNGNFSTLVIAGGKNWILDGRYVMTAAYHDTMSREFFSFENNDIDSDSDDSTSKPKEKESLGIASFVDPDKDPVYYVERYQNEPEYRDWFDRNYPEYESIFEAVGLPEPAEKQVPEWIKNNAGWWAEGNIDDKTFVNGIGFLVKEKIIDVPVEPKCPEGETLIDGICMVPDPLEETPNVTNVPDWIKNNAEWWSEGLITEDDFLKGIEYLVKNGIIQV